MSRSYQVAVIMVVPPNEEIEAFRQQFMSGLGYCPQSLINPNLFSDKTNFSWFQLSSSLKGM